MKKKESIIRLEARINHIMLIATFHGAPCKFSIENVMSILSVSESGVMNVTMYIPIKFIGIYMVTFMTPSFNFNSSEAIKYIIFIHCTHYLFSPWSTT